MGLKHRFFFTGRNALASVRITVGDVVVRIDHNWRGEICAEIEAPREKRIDLQDTPADGGLTAPLGSQLPRYLGA